MLRSMKSAFVLCALALVACGPGSSDCPSGWTDSVTAPGRCAAPTTFISDTQTAIGSGVYGFMRTNAHGGTNQLVVGAKVFALPSTSTTCDAASVNAVADATTDENGVYILKLAAGDYRITSGEIPACLAVHVDANTLTDVALTSP
jgi:hypothetical protein